MATNVLEKILRKLNGSEAATAIAGALADLQAGREEKRARLRAAEERRAEALREFQYAVAEKLEGTVADLRRQIASDDLHEPELLHRLTDARAAEAAETRKTAALAYLAAAEKFARQVSIADDAGCEAAEIFERNETLLRGVIEPQGAALVLGARERWGAAWAGKVFDYISAVRARLAGTIDKPAAAAPAPRQESPARRQAAAAAYIPPRAAPISSTSAPPSVVRLRAERAPDARVEDLKAGQVLVSVLSSGYSPADDQPQAYAGQRVAMSELRARHAESIGKVRILATYSQGEQLGEQPEARQ